MQALCASKSKAIIDMSCREFAGLLWVIELAGDFHLKTPEELGGISEDDKKKAIEARQALQNLRETFAKSEAMSCERSVVSVPAAG